MAWVRLRRFLKHLEKRGEVLRISRPVDVAYEAGAIADLLVKNDGPAVVFEQPRLADGSISPMPVEARLRFVTAPDVWYKGMEPCSFSLVFSYPSANRRVFCKVAKNISFPQQCFSSGHKWVSVFQSSGPYHFLMKDFEMEQMVWL